MKYHLEFQYMPKGHGRPLDDGAVLGLETEDTAVIPNVGDYVDLIEMEETKDRSHFHGRVRSRLFRYFGLRTCTVNLVVEEVEGDVWGELIKE